MSAATLDRAVVDALARGGLVDITTMGRRSGRPRRIEIVLHNLDGRLLISGRPGRTRSWIANLRASPRMTLHLKGAVGADLPGTARVVTERAEREELLRPIARAWRMDHATMVRSSPLIEVTLD